MSRDLLQFRATCAALLGIAAVTFVCFRLIHANSTTVALLLLLVLLLSGMRLNFPGTIVAAIAAAFCLDWYFIPPIGRITIGDTPGFVALGVFLTVAVLASRFSNRLRQQRDELAARQQEVEKLYAFSRSMLLSGGTEDTRRLVVNKCIQLFGFEEVVLFDTAGPFYRSEAVPSIEDKRLRHVALCGSVESDAESKTTIVPVTLGNKTFGSLGLRGTCLSAAGLQSLANTVAVSLAQAQAQEAGSRAEAVQKSEELKSVMIDALAHDLKTPLTAIEAASQMLRESVAISNEQRRDLLEIIQEETGKVKQWLAEALHLARIDAKRLKLELVSATASDLVQAAIASLSEMGMRRQIIADVSPDTAPVLVDRELAIQALKQLLDNAVKYSPAEAPILVSAAERKGGVSLSVRDYGQGLTELEQTRVFDKFYRGRYDHSAVQGTGMGLSIAKEIAEAHGGSISVESNLGQGSLFAIVFRAAPAPALRENQLV